ncbi:MAG: hypothetical protein PHW27_07465 [Melioribacteraceae bacterium]|nr:hypothetical protein [Melioribacteraceae bacterium]
MQKFNLAIAYKWKYDKDLIDLIEQIFQARGSTTYIVHQYNVHETFDKVSNNRLFFEYYLDRASDEDELFEPLAQLITSKETIVINPYSIVEESVDKVRTYKKLKRTELNFPLTYILPPYFEKPNYKISKSRLEKIGFPFVVKPSYYTGGGDGVHENVFSYEEIQKIRQELPDDHYLIQQKVDTIELDFGRAWLRVFYFFGKIIPVWWDDKTHIYREITNKEYMNFEIEEIVESTKKIASITKMDYFSSEFTINSDDEFVAIDFVNDQCDFRFQSKHVDGVPDRIVRDFAEKLFEIAGTKK